MTDVYEFHIAGLISPVVRSALPELVAATGSRDTVITGRADEPGEIDDLLQRLYDNGLIATHIVIGRHARWHGTLDPGRDPPGMTTIKELRA
jgi:hypothetical protein